MPASIRARPKKRRSFKLQALSNDRERARNCFGPMLECAEVVSTQPKSSHRRVGIAGILSHYHTEWENVCKLCVTWDPSQKFAEVQDLTHYVGRYWATPIERS